MNDYKGPIHIRVRSGLARIYIASMFLLAVVLATTLGSMLVWRESNWILASLWVGGVFVVSLNLCYLIVACLCALFVKPRVLAEASISALPHTAILFVVKNEGDELATKLVETYNGNCETGVDCWLVSSSDQEERVRWEATLVRELQARFGTERIHYYRPFEGEVPGRKHVAIQRWVEKNENYNYFIVCDADSVLYPNVVRKLVSKAEHPDNAHILLFQSQLDVARSPTRFGKYLEPGQNVVHSVLCTANYRILDCSPYYGHGALIRRAPFAAIKVPAHVLSHDMWDIAAIDAAGWGLAFCHDTMILESYPANYLDYRRRSRRWILGTLEAIPLLFRRDVGLGTRFYLALAVYSYLVVPILFLWIILGLLMNNALSGPLVTTQSLILGGSAVVDIEMGGVCLGTVGFMWAYKLLFCRSFKHALLLIRDVIAGTVTLLNNLVYDTIYIVTAPWSAKTWAPMPKGPARQLTLRKCMGAMLPSTACGVVWVIMGFRFAPHWAWSTSPVWVSFLLGGLTVYLTSRPDQEIGEPPVAVSAASVSWKDVQDSRLT